MKLRFDMSFDEAMIEKAIREWNHEAATNELKAVSGDERGPMGLTPDHVKQTPEWQNAYAKERKAFFEMRNLNMWIAKHYKKEYRALTNHQRAAKMAAIQQKGN